MKKAFVTGFLFVIVMALVSTIQNDWTLIYKVCGTVGLASLLLSGIFLGAFVNGMQVRANFLTETKKERQNRNRYAYVLFAFGIPNLAAGLIFIITL